MQKGGGAVWTGDKWEHISHPNEKALHIKYCKHEAEAYNILNIEPGQHISHPNMIQWLKAAKSGNSKHKGHNQCNQTFHEALDNLTYSELNRAETQFKNAHKARKDLQEKYRIDSQGLYVVPLIDSHDPPIDLIEWAFNEIKRKMTDIRPSKSKPLNVSAAEFKPSATATAAEEPASPKKPSPKTQSTSGKGKKRLNTRKKRRRRKSLKKSQKKRKRRRK